MKPTDASRDPVYRTLTPLKRGLGSLSQLALGPDHLLHINSTGYSESYRRFFLRDIKAMLIVHTGRRAIYAALLICWGVIVASITHTAGGGPVGWVIVLTIVGGLLLWNHLRGPGCRVVVITAVQQENIPSLCRLPRTRKILAELRPLIEAAQAGLATGPLPASAEPPVVPPPLQPPPLPLA